MAEIPRLHYLYISSKPIHWVEFFRELRNPQDDWEEFGVFPGEELNLSGIAYRIYGLTYLDYVIREALGLDDPMTRVVAGTLFKVPKVSWLRERIIFFKKKADQIDG